MQKLAASAKYLSPVTHQSDWTEKAAADWQRMQPIFAGAGQAASAPGFVPGAGAVAAGAAPILSAMSKLQVGAVDELESPSIEVAGESAREAFAAGAAGILSLSGTPFRTGRDPIVFVPSEGRTALALAHPVRLARDLHVLAGVARPALSPAIAPRTSLNRRVQTGRRIRFVRLNLAAARRGLGQLRCP